MNNKIEMDVQWVFRLRPAETRLVLSALGGRLRDDQAEDAQKLCDELTLLRARYAGQLADELEKHAEKVAS